MTVIIAVLLTSLALIAHSLRARPVLRPASLGRMNKRWLVAQSRST